MSFYDFKLQINVKTIIVAIAFGMTSLENLWCNKFITVRAFLYALNNFYSFPYFLIEYFPSEKS